MVSLSPVCMVEHIGGQCHIPGVYQYFASIFCKHITHVTNVVITGFLKL